MVSSFLFFGFTLVQTENSQNLDEGFSCPSGDKYVCAYSHTLGTIYKGKGAVILN